MKIASVTLFCNEGFRLNPWVRYFSEYKDDIYLQIIVNNGNLKNRVCISFFKNVFNCQIIRSYHIWRF